MKLEDYSIQREPIPLPGKAVNGVKPFFEVRGLNLADMTFLVQRHLGPITRALKLWQESREDVIRTGNVSQFVMVIAKDFPELAAEVISAAADELTEGATAKARQLPIAAQIAALAAISRLSMEDAGGLGNLLAEMQQRLKSVAGVELQS
jgi:hypothetical protein